MTTTPTDPLDTNGLTTDELLVAILIELQAIREELVKLNAPGGCLVNPS